MEKRNTVVFDFAFEGFLGNNLFDYENVKRYPGAGVWPLLGEKLEGMGYRCVTGDAFLDLQDNTYEKAYLLSEMITPFTEKILRKEGVVPVCILSGESPNVATSFYRNLKKYTSLYRNSILFGECKDAVSNDSRFQPFLWPNHDDRIAYSTDWKERRLLAMVASNKRRLVVDESKPFYGIRKILKSALLLYLRLTNTTFKYKDLYSERLNAIRFFHKTDGFDLFGKGWDDTSRLNKSDREIIRKINPTEVDDKLETLSNYRFSLCFENCVFPGYITEKIFDSFFAGCIPVYYGAPDIAEFIPKETFVDFRDFRSLADLEGFLRSITENEYSAKLTSIREFLKSNQFKQFTESRFADQILSMIG